MKIRADEHVSEEIVRAVRELALSDGWELTSVVASGYGGADDLHWATKFAAEGGQAIVSGDSDFFKHHHLVIAMHDAGLQIVHMPSKWSNAPGHLQLAHTLVWWRRIETALASGTPKNCWRPPWNISESGDIQRIKVDYEAHRKKARKADRPSRQNLHQSGA